MTFCGWRVTDQSTAVDSIAEIDSIKLIKFERPEECELLIACQPIWRILAETELLLSPIDNY